MSAPRTKLQLIPHHDVPSHILVDLTMATFGYDPRRLKSNSCKLVLCSCTSCGTQRTKQYRLATSQLLCIACSNARNSRVNIAARSHKLTERWKVIGHPRKGIAHTDEARRRMSEARIGVPLALTPCGRQRLAEHCRRVLHDPEVAARTVAINRTRRGPLSPAYGKPPAHTRKTWYVRTDGSSVCFRSTWEAAFASWLDRAGTEWDYEPKTFPVLYTLHNAPVRGTYTPDFIAGGAWFEVKGRWTLEGTAKFQAFREQYSTESIVVVDRDWLSSRKLLPYRPVAFDSHGEHIIARAKLPGML